MMKVPCIKYFIYCFFIFFAEEVNDLVFEGYGKQIEGKMPRYFLALVMKVMELFLKKSIAETTIRGQNDTRKFLVTNYPWLWMRIQHLH